MTLDYAVAQLMARLVDWSNLPKYQLERRIDIFLTPFLEAFLTSKLGSAVRLVAPEFPVLSELLKAGYSANRDELSSLTVNMDYLLRVEATEPFWMLLELKTDDASFKPSQADIYAIARERGMPELITDLAKVKKATEPRHRWKYHRLLERLPSAKHAGQPIKVGYLGPHAIEERALNRIFPGEKTDRLAHRQEPARVVDHYFTLQAFASMPLSVVPVDVQALWPYVRDLLRAIDQAPLVRPTK